MKRIILLILAAAFLIPSAAAAPFTLQTDSQSAFMMSLDTGQTVFDKASDVRRAPASLTKIMTALVVLENCADPENETITVPDVSLFQEIKDDGGVEIALIQGETFTVSDLLHAMMLASACDAAQLLAWHFGGGSVENFVAKMNEKAASLGMENTHYVNPHGLEALDHYSSARDVATSVLASLENSFFVSIISGYTYVIPKTEKSSAREITYTIAMLNPNGSLYYPGMIGVKSGYTSQAGRCLASVAEKNGMKFLLVVMGANLGAQSSTYLSYTDTAALYDYAFSNLELRDVLNTTEVYAQIPVTGAENETAVELRSDRELKIVCPRGAEIKLAISVPETLEAPVSEGKLGTVEVFVSDELTATADLVNAAAIAAAVKEPDPVSPYTMPENGNILTNDRVTLILLIVLAALILLTALLARIGKKKRQ
ncbi:MAG: D-alanyl-D-alanine carboxypeptidase [Clostridia bacterium]|nr:D-alanyl-D-alanine carboxypeptidase [Clostridia bacterium]